MSTLYYSYQIKDEEDNTSKDVQQSFLNDKNFIDVFRHIRDREDITTKNKCFTCLAFSSDLILTSVATAYWLGHFLDLFKLFQTSSKILELSAPAFYISLFIGLLAAIGYAYANLLLNLQEASKKYEEKNPLSSTCRYSGKKQWSILSGFWLTALVDIASTDFVLLLIYPNLSPKHEILLHMLCALIALTACYADMRTRKNLIQKKNKNEMESEYNEYLNGKNEEKNNDKPNSAHSSSSLKDWLNELREDKWSAFSAFMEFICVWLSMMFIIAEFIDPNHLFQQQKTFFGFLKQSSISAGIIVGFFLALTAACCHYTINNNHNGNTNKESVSNSISLSTKNIREFIAFVHYLSDILEVMTGIVLCYEVAFGVHTNKLPLYLIVCTLGAIFSLAPYNTSRNALGGLSHSNTPLWVVTGLIILPSIGAIFGMYVNASTLHFSQAKKLNSVQCNTLMGACAGLILGLLILTFRAKLAELLTAGYKKASSFSLFNTQKTVLIKPKSITQRKQILHAT